MSWRFMLVVLFIAAGLSAWGGITLGHWLIAHGPEPSPVAEELLVSDVDVLDADGRPYTAQPPQPLVDGRLGVPEPVTHIAWDVPETSLAEQADELPIAIATTTITLEQARGLSDTGEFQGLADVGDLIGALQRGQQGLQPIEVPPPPPAPVPGTQAQTDGDWQHSLRQEINACSNLGFFERPSCAWAARNKYCGPNNAWGQTRDCPARSF